MKAFIVKLTFEDIDPLIWRRVILPAGATFNRLHEMIQYVTNFQSRYMDEPYHYFDIEVDGLFITNNPYTHEEYKKEFNGLKLKRPSHLKIDTYLEGNRQILYRYDSGDDWRIMVELEGIVEDYYFGYPTVLEGEGAAPPEDVGGPPGYAHFLDVYHDPKHPDYLSTYEWAEAQCYKPFDIEKVNESLKYVKYKKTEWDRIDHENYNVKSDKYRGPKQLKQAEPLAGDLILDYIVACTNLYGVVPHEKVREIYSGQNKLVISSEMMKAMVTDLPTVELLKRRHVLVEGRNFYHEAMDYVDEVRLMKNVEGKPFYVPEKDKLLHYVKDTYFERTPQQLVLGQLMVKDGFPARTINSEIEELLGELSVPFSNVLSVFQTFAGRLELNNRAQVNSYLQCVTEIANTTRLWENRGHTPNELFPSEKPYLHPLPGESTKTGRNDPCPCGSGKKYKKCCGK
ncbi:plasmid pRiA4b ORF-3 family protein [Sporosarcina highlanderae]|uniref:Plasmid pRiA4b ORF-3 family protein n=1 Tax=Sporosarcina highlanderae TaxID=3035916 RepID=A0ABT8JSD5_9BACL|nr:plasmid pRiA4b ORF-3 family protein [Sporosarcina highlanderae]MDN4608081.1 plasmid pRiA4b ORF-3 family protein [Sporosarcina highlanderae]